MDRAERIFLEASALAIDERGPFLEAACRGEPELKLRVERMLKAASSADRWLEDLGRRLGPVGSRLRPEAEIGTTEGETVVRPPVDRVGPWGLTERLGQGGMGSVWLGVRDDGAFDQRVAVKFLSVAAAAPTVIRRFEAERRILARLEHPDVARLLDGGVTERGVPWLAMELVEGRPIDRWCDEKQLTIPERIGLFRRVCEAVQQAHRQLIVHRDLKPGNILVTEEGRVKLLDFGIAKVLDEEAEVPGAPTLLTRLGGSPLTPSFASPEQLQGDPVTTASDVYALGVLLYLLLSGRLPYDLEGCTLLEVIRRVGEGPPPPPSAAAVPSAPEQDPTAEEIARRRGTTRERLGRILSGDLDTIVLKATAREAERRYLTVEQLAEDLRRWEEGLPITARPDTRLYRAGKFLRRNPWKAAAAFLLPAAFLTALLVHVDRLEAERDLARVEAEKAEQVTAFLTSLFEGADPAEARGEEITARELLDRGLERMDAFEGDPRIGAQLYMTLARVTGALGSYDEAERLLLAALQLSEKLYGSDGPETSEVLVELGRTLSLLGRYDEAQERLRRALEVSSSPAVNADGLRSGALNALASVLTTLEKHEEAEELHWEDVELRRRLFGPRSAELAEGMEGLGVHYQQRGRFEEAGRLFRQALEIRREVLGEDHPAVARSLSNVGAVLRAAGSFEEAADRYRETVGLRRRLLGDDHPAVGEALFDLGLVYWEAKEVDRAEEPWREALRIHRLSLGDYHPITGRSLTALAAIAREREDFDESERLLEETLDIYRRSYGEGSSRVAVILNNLGALQASRGLMTEVEPYYREALQIRREAFGEIHPDVAHSLLNLSYLYTDLRRHEEALKYAREALAVRSALFEEEHPLIREVHDLMREIEELDVSASAPVP